MLEQTPTPSATGLVVRVEAAEMDEMWSFMQSKRPQRWLWHALDPQTGVVLAYVLAPQVDAVLKALIQLLTPFGIQQFYTDSGGLTCECLSPNSIRLVRQTRSVLNENT